VSGAARLLAFAALLGAVFAIAAVAGGAVDPDRGASDDPSTHGGSSSHGVDAATAPRGLATADGDLRLVALDTELPRGRSAALRFRIEDAQGNPVREFTEEHERDMHLIVVRRDLTGYRHLHPEMAPDGTWTTRVRLPAAGAYRAFADFNAGGEDHTLGFDLHVPGGYRPAPLPHPRDSARADGYEVTLTSGDGGELGFSVRKHGRAVTDIEPYLGARGHLVALREGDLAFLHVHPEDEATEGPDVDFRAEYPSRGAYRLFLQFKHDGAVHTAAFTEEVSDGDGH
jgi:hypothetical protein